MLRLISLAMLVCAMSLPTFAADVDLDNDGRTDYQFGGSEQAASAVRNHNGTTL